MPTRQHQLNRILADIDRQISEAEARMLTSLSDFDLRQLIEKIADLHVLKREVESTLNAGENNSPSAH